VVFGGEGVSLCYRVELLEVAKLCIMLMHSVGPYHHCLSLAHC
jgi:hypothetical protein